MGSSPMQITEDASDNTLRRSNRNRTQTTVLSHEQGHRQTTTEPSGTVELAGVAEEELVDDEMIEHIANHCQMHLVAHGVKHELEVELDEETVVCLAKLDKLDPHQFAQVFKAAKGKNPDALSHEEAMADYENLKDWLASAPKEIRQLESKGVWVECKKSEAKGQQINLCTWVF